MECTKNKNTECYFETDKSIISDNIKNPNQRLIISPDKIYYCLKHGPVKEVVIFHYDVDKIEKGRHYCTRCLENLLRGEGLIPLTIIN